MFGPPTLSPHQCQAARALLCWSQAQLAAQADVARQSISRFESGRPLDLVDLISIRRVLEAADIEFTVGTDGSSGVRLATRQSSRHAARDLD
jgi:DNA-binding XRE family transcriptional regulator